VGKGTQARMLSKVWSIPHISTGELLRSNVAEDTFLGRSVKEIISRGDLVPDSLINEMVEARLSEPDTRYGYILDGFPRTLDQAMWLTELLTKLHGGTPFLPIHVHMGKGQLLRRITGRRHCPRCLATFNIYENRPKRNGFCDIDDEGLIQRSDDTEEIAKKRLEAYDALTMPIIRYFQSCVRFVEVSGDGPIEWITQRILGAYRLVTFEVLIEEVRATPQTADGFQGK